MLMCLVNSPSAYRDLGGIRGRVLISTDESVSWRAPVEGRTRVQRRTQNAFARPHFLAEKRGKR